MARVLLEDSWQFQPIRSKITESKIGKLTVFKIPGILSKADVANGNGRTYPYAVWEAQTKEDSVLMQLIKRNAAFGLMEHPKDGIVDLNSPISHLMTAVKLESDGTVTGEITILDELFDGHRLRVLIEAGYDPLVSSRGFGSVIKNASGLDEVQMDFVCEGWDIVSKPSFTIAQLNPNREISTTESISVPAKGKPMTENLGAPAPKVAAVAPLQKVTMDLNSIRMQVNALRSFDPAKAPARQIAESFMQADTIQRQLSVAGATDPNVAYDCKKIGDELDRLAEDWSKVIDGPRKEVEQLRTQQTKLMAIAESLAKAARTYRTQLSEAIQKRKTLTEAFEAVAQRGRGWHKFAESQNKKTGKLEHQIAVSCAAIDMLAEQVNSGESEVGKAALAKLAEQYHTETTKLARQVLEMTYPEEAKKDDIKKLLDEAKTSEAVEAVKTKIEEAKKNAPQPAGAVNESTKPNTATTAASLQESTPAAATVAEGIQVMNMGHSSHGFSVEESIGIARRLSPVKKTAQATAAAAA